MEIILPTSQIKNKYNVTRESYSKISKHFSWSNWKLHTNIWRIHEFDDFDLPILKKCLYICIAVKNYCKDSVEDILLDYIQNV